MKISKQQSDGIKGFFALLVVIHHVCIYAQATAGWPSFLAIPWINITDAFGWFSVTIFFFLSGYGLAAAYREKGVVYAKWLIPRKVIPLYCIVAVTALLYWGFKALIGFDISVGMFISTFGFGYSLIENGWFLQVIIPLYIVFSISYSLMQEKGAFLIAFVVIAYVVMCMWCGLSKTVYLSVPAFPIGLLWRKFVDRMGSRIATKRYRYGMMGVLALFFAAACIQGKIWPSDAVLIGLRMVFNIVLLIWVASLLPLVKFDNVVFRFLGKIYLEIYLVHGAFVLLFRRGRFDVHESLGFYLIAVFICTFIAALLLKPVSNAIMKRCACLLGVGCSLKR